MLLWELLLLADRRAASRPGSLCSFWILQRQIREVEEARTRQIQVDVAQTASEDSDNMEAMIDRIANPEEAITPHTTPHHEQ